MEKVEGFDNAIPMTGEYERIEAGGYICKIIGAREEKTKASGKRMLVLALDIIEGEHAGFFTKRYEELKKANNDPNNTPKYPTGGIYRQMLEGEKAAGYFKGMITSIEESNPNFKWDWDETKLKGLKCGAIFGEEEYYKNDGTIGIISKIKWIRSVNSIKEGKFQVPELKKVAPQGEAYEGFPTASTSDDDLPF